MPQENLWAPWRMQYIRQLASDADRERPSSGCFLCDAATADVPSDDADRQYILLRDERGVLMLNRFPYTNGHLLIAPPEHVGSLTDLSAGRRAQMMELAALGEELLRNAVAAQGVNLGINLGAAAGAGVPGHLHMHLVPRWAGDTNYMSAVGNVRVIPDSLDASFAHLRNVLSKMLQ